MRVDRFGILFVCHANLCRSPLAERLARRAFDDAFGPAAATVDTASAGTRAYAGCGMHRNSADVLAECGADPGGFVSRAVTPALLAGADLVLTATREQRSACLTLAPGAVRRTFTLRQFARFTAAAPAPGAGPVPERLRELVDGVNATRHAVPATAGEDDDLPDPVGRPVEAFRECAEDVWRSLRALVTAVS